MDPAHDGEALPRPHSAEGGARTPTVKRQEAAYVPHDCLGTLVKSVNVYWPQMHQNKTKQRKPHPVLPPIMLASRKSRSFGRIASSPKCRT